MRRTIRNVLVAGVLIWAASVYPDVSVGAVQNDCTFWYSTCMAMGCEPDGPFNCQEDPISGRTVCEMWCWCPGGGSSHGCTQ